MDETSFNEATARYRRELQLHCYRMLGSFSDSEDMVQETLLRAWRGRGGFAGRSSLRAWLYAIATNGCIDFLEARRERVVSSDGSPEPLWLQPYPDRHLPDAAVAGRQTIELAYIAALQHLPARQRAVLILCDVLDWSANETAALLELSVASVTSALQRARATLKERSGRKPSPPDDDRQRSLLRSYVEATERGDVNALAALLRDDLRWSMPPDAGSYEGRDAVVSSWVKGGFGSPSFGEFRCVVTGANGMPAVACYVRKPGEPEFRALALDVLTIDGAAIAEIVTFPLEGAAAWFGLPPTL